ncbi:MAG: CdaR family protein [Thermodesulfovibrionales bacterium]|nr:CdaR family protein [Thermodesulfovibrionales bacterium]
MIKRKKFAQRLLENIWLLIFAILTSVSLWFFIVYKGQSETVVEANIEFKNVPKGVEILRQNVKRVNLSVRGPERLLKNLSPSELKVFVDLSNAKFGESIHYFDKQNVGLPKAVKVLKIEPNHIRIFLDESISRVLPVKAILVGSPEKGYTVQSIKVIPTTAKIEGPKNEISKIRFLKTEPIEITGIDSEMTINAKLNLDGKMARVEPSDVLVTIDVIRRTK